MKTVTSTALNMQPVVVCRFSELVDRQPHASLVKNVDLVVVRYDDQVSVLYGRCPHRGAMLADGRIDGQNLICGMHDWDFRYDTGVSEYNNAERIAKFDAWIDRAQDAVLVDGDQILQWEQQHPQFFQRDTYLGQYADLRGTPEEPHNGYIQQLAQHGLEEWGHHGAVSAMGVPLIDLPRWEDLQILTAQLATRPLADDADVGTELVIGRNAIKPLVLKIPIFVSDMSFGALSQEAKIALARGAELAGTGICSGEGGMLDEEQAENSRYLYEHASGKFGWSIEEVQRVQAFHFKAGQGAKTGTGGHLPGVKVTGRIAEVRGLKEGEPAVSPSRFADLRTPRDFRRLADEVREMSGGIPIGFKLSAQHIEDDLDFAIDASADYIILDGRGGGTGAAPDVFKNNISVATIPAIARARHHLDRRRVEPITLIATGGLRTESDFLKAMALGADGVAIANSAMQAIGCIGMRACHTNNCPVGIATQRDHLRERLVVAASAKRLQNFLLASIELMKALSRACGHDHLSKFTPRDLTTYKREIAELSGVRHSGVGSSQTLLTQ